MADAPPPGEFIDEDPMTKREIDEALFYLLTRSQRRRTIRVLHEAGLIVFRGEGN